MIGTELRDLAKGAMKNPENWYKILLIGIARGAYLKDYIKPGYLQEMRRRGWLDDDNEITEAGQTQAGEFGVAYKLGAYRDKDED
jgi:hypothetical protein